MKVLRRIVKMARVPKRIYRETMPVVHMRKIPRCILSAFSGACNLGVGLGRISTADVARAVGGLEHWVKERPRLGSGREYNTYFYPTFRLFSDPIPNGSFET